MQHWRQHSPRLETRSRESAIGDSGVHDWRRSSGSPRLETNASKSPRLKTNASKVGANIWGKLVTRQVEILIADNIVLPFALPFLMGASLVSRYFLAYSRASVCTPVSDAAMRCTATKTHHSVSISTALFIFKSHIEAFRQQLSAFKTVVVLSAPKPKPKTSGMRGQPSDSQVAQVNGALAAFGQQK